VNVPLTLAETTDFPRRRWPVTSGVPLLPGTLAKGEALRLTDARGQTLPLQWEPLAYWPDGSVQWALLDFLADTRPGQAAKLQLEAGAPAPPPAQRVTVSRQGSLITLRTGVLTIRADTADFRLINSAQVLRDGRWVEILTPGDGLLVRDGRGTEYLGCRGPVQAVIERRGPLRATVAFHGEHRSRSGGRCFSFTVRLHVFAGCDFVKVEHQLLNDNPTGVFTAIREVAIRLRPAGGITRATLGGAGEAQSAARLLQVDHEGWQALGTKVRKGRRAPGWVTVGNHDVALTALIRDFWQQWPKSLEVRDDQLTLGLFPTLAPHQYAGREPLEKYYYLFKGDKYQLKTGVAKRHEVWLGLGTPAPPSPGDRRSHGRGDGGAEAIFAVHANSPLMALAAPEHVCATGVHGSLIPAGTPASRGYDRAEAKCFAAYTEAVEAEGFYGVLNWGDWFGEREYNWGNEEYDTQHAFFLQLARTGDPRYFRWGEANARHCMDVDVVHALNDDYLNNWEVKHGYGFPIHVGAVYLHAIGHTGGYFSEAFGKRRWPQAYYAGDPRNLGHLWNEGFVDYHCLTGDPWAKEVALQVADNLEQLSRLPGFDWWIGRDPHCGRVAGWPLKALLAAYRLTRRRKYVQAARRIIERLLADQDPHCGGWIYKLYPGHCFCRTPHWGMAVFITAVMLNGMISYYEATGDARVIQSIIRGVEFSINDAWDEKEARFRYTSCPASALMEETLILRAMAFAARHSANPRLREVLERAYGHWLEYIAGAAQLEQGFGKSYGFYNRETPHTVADRAR